MADPTWLQPASARRAAILAAIVAGSATMDARGRCPLFAGGRTSQSTVITATMYRFS
jgi:hypothetical protein